jgi:copper resistance protein C
VTRACSPAALLATGSVTGLLLLTVGAAPALAHTELVDSTPASGSRLTAAPDAVRLQFSEPVSPELAQVVVTAPDGRTVVSGPARVGGATVTQLLPALRAPGSYRIAYRVVADDGHPVVGELGFTATAAAAGVLAAATAAPTAVGAPAAQPAAPLPQAVETFPQARAGTAGGVGTGPVVLVALAALGVGLVVTTRRRGPAGAGR